MERDRVYSRIWDKGFEEGKKVDRRELVEKGDEWVMPMREAADLRELEKAYEDFAVWWQAKRREVGE